MSDKVKEVYFCTKLTENEHYFVGDFIKNLAERLKVSLMYYRKLKNGHIPGYRECKVTGEAPSVNRLIEAITRKDGLCLKLHKYPIKKGGVK